MKKNLVVGFGKGWDTPDLSPFFEIEVILMASGIIKWFNESKGYGCITPDDGSHDLLVHHSAIEDNLCLRVLFETQQVYFDIKNGPLGPLAVNVIAKSPI